jgi:hypothetical protein
MAGNSTGALDALRILSGLDQQKARSAVAILFHAITL